jgi:hypothetical protein
MARTWWQTPAIIWAITALSLAAAFGCSGSGSTTPSPRAYPSTAPGSALAATTSAATAATPPIDAGATDAPRDATGFGGEHCGTERWPVKTLSDGDAARVNFNPVPATVTDLRALPAPGSLPQASRIAPTELTTFSVTANVVEFKIETDLDIHLVIADPNDASATMIVEFPNAADCSGAVASAHRANMETARQALINTFGQPSSSHFTSITGTITLAGVGFFDFKHGQTGVAPNAIELHPVLSVASGTSAPPPNTSAPPPPPPDHPPPSASGVAFVSVVGAAPGGVASAIVQTSAGASCSISYRTPAGTKSTAQGLSTKTAGADGMVSWSWNISGNTRPGTGTVTVTCGGASASAPITIG